jgi:phage-related protein
VNKPLQKSVTFVGSSLDDLHDFPQSARRETGFQLDKVQNGEDADDWKPTARRDLALGKDRYQEVLAARK